LQIDGIILVAGHARAPTKATFCTSLFIKVARRLRIVRLPYNYREINAFSLSLSLSLSLSSSLNNNYRSHSLKIIIVSISLPLCCVACLPARRVLLLRHFNINFPMFNIAHDVINYFNIRQIKSLFIFVRVHRTQYWAALVASCHTISEFFCSARTCVPSNAARNIPSYRHSPPPHRLHTPTILSIRPRAFSFFFTRLIATANQVWPECRVITRARDGRKCRLLTARDTRETAERPIYLSS